MSGTRKLSVFAVVLGIFLLVTALDSARAQTNTFPTTGNVGIGTTSPQGALDVGDGAIWWDYVPQPTNYFANSYLNVDGSGNSNLTYLAFKIHGWPGSTVTPLVLTGSGNAGIGTTSPSVPLEISTTAGGNPVVQKIVRTGGNAGGEGPVLEFDDFLDSVPQGHIYTSLYNIPSAANAVGKLILGSHGNAAATSSSFNDELTLFNGNVGIGTADPGERLELSGNLKMSGAGSHITFPDSSTQATAWTGVLCGGDYAESVDVSGDRKHYEPGDVMVIDPDQPGKFLKSAEPYSTGVTGVFATKPGVIGRRQTTDLKASTTEVPMAMIGIVPTRVSAENGPIKPGDLLVTSSTPGYAMKGTDRNRMLGAVIGKALGRLDSGTGSIEMVVTLQ